MSKTIKVIDLLNKIANGEEVPEKIKFEGDILKYDRGIQDYKGILRTGSGSFFNYLFVNRSTSLFINDTVEIIEEQEEIDIQSIEEMPKILFLGTEKNDLMKVLNDIIDNQNLQLQAVKQLDKKIKEK